jgi:hypothetical protein
MTEIKQDNGVSVITLQFEDVRRPYYREDKVRGFIKYGEQNDYPEYLLDLFESSGKHAAIIGGKANYIVGNGFAFEDDNVPDRQKAILDKANNKGESLTQVGAKVALDLEIFAGAYVEILFNRLGKVSEIYHLDFSKMRSNKDLSKFYYSEEWTREMPNGRLFENKAANIIELEPFNPLKPRGKQVLYIREYRPKQKVYPKPNYFAALRYVMIDILIGEYHLNGISNGMFASKLVNFNNGVPEPDQQKEIEKKVNNKFAGSKNAGKIMLSFNKSAENAPTILDLSGTEMDKHFDLLDKTVEKQIFSSHRVTSPSLFGIRTESLFGNRTELRDAFELFQNTYINEKRTLIEQHFNAILSLNRLPKVYLQRSEPLGISFSEQTIAQVLTTEEIRETLGKKPLTPEQKADLLQPKANAAAPNTGGVPSKFSAQDDESDALVFAEFGQSKADFIVKLSKKVLSEKDLDFADATTIKGIKKSIIELIVDDPLIEAKTIASALDISESEAESYIESLINDKLITTNDKGEKIPTSDAKDQIDSSDTTTIKVMYSYEGIKDAKNRPFCSKMLELNRLYTREDIEGISARLGYSVWDRRGGWYRPKGADEARPFCRHFWKANTVINKS